MEEETSGGKLIVMFNMMTPYILMVCVRFGSAGYVPVVHRNGVAALVLAPLALILEMSLNSTVVHILFRPDLVQPMNMELFSTVHFAKQWRAAKCGRRRGGEEQATLRNDNVWLEVETTGGDEQGLHKARPEPSTTEGKSDLELPDIATTGAEPGDFFRVPD
ncbi:hypothetical protein NC652_005954 [Populus alba x Populus x berolinensis]|nr:hypothetical protein NC652_005944 [Populus alba x Populus x berolinensis]KAJ6954363.1 hypothetical protein NC652_005947 [Populus alba x Populus x berolinensis]KAJ6954371.1 hypothetical protein NC652_005954 [Populus alba x Populus x berolinensis]